MAEAAREAGPIPMRDFPFGREEFEALRRIVQRMTDIDLPASRQEVLYARFAERARAVGVADFGAYAELLERAPAAELPRLLSALSTRTTGFFRGPHHFTWLRHKVLEPLAADAHGPRRLRIWSAGCSTGEEPYSIAMTVLDSIPAWRGWDIRILATDIDETCLAVARQATYTAHQLQGIDARRQACYFRSSGSGEQAVYTIAPDVAGLVTFQRLNLLEELRAPEPSHVVFCRNVVGFMDAASHRRLFGRIAELQEPGNVLFAGDAEAVFAMPEEYAQVCRTGYMRRAPVLNSP